MNSRWKWQELYGQYISKSFERTITGTALGETSTVLQKLSQLLVLWIGASLVLKGQLSLGQLIAFRIISSYVTQPLLRLSSIWQNIQELRVSFEWLADIVDTPEETSKEDIVSQISNASSVRQLKLMRSMDRPRKHIIPEEILEDQDNSTYF